MEDSDSKLLKAIRKHIAEHTSPDGSEYLTEDTGHCEALDLLAQALAEMSTCENCGLDQ